MGIGLVLRIGGVIGCALAAHQIVVVMEHIRGTRYSLRTPVLAHIDGSQAGAVVDQSTHIGHVGRIETAQVKARKTAAATEHVKHVCHIGCVETAQVKARQASTVTEHDSHFCHLGCIKTAYINVRQTRASIEHVSHIGNLTGVQILNALDSLKIPHQVKP